MSVDLGGHRILKKEAAFEGIVFMEHVLNSYVRLQRLGPDLVRGVPAEPRARGSLRQCGRGSGRRDAAASQESALVETRHVHGGAVLRRQAEQTEVIPQHIEAAAEAGRDRGLAARARRIRQTDTW